MKPHAEAILKKMETSSYLELSFDFAFKLTNESERGAILVGASKVEVYLEKLIRSILPNNTKKYTERLMSYPGSLSSFSGKIELCYAFRIIDERVYDALTILRKVRNEAAHSNETFSLKEFVSKLEKIYDFEDGFVKVVNDLAFKNLLKWKKENVRQVLIKNNFTEFDLEELFKRSLANPDKDEVFQEHLRIWKLFYGLTFLSLKIEVIQEEWEEKINSPHYHLPPPQ